MSSIIVAGDVSGSVTLQAPSVAGTTTLTLPSTSGTVITGTGGVTSVDNGGTGSNTLTANNVLLGNGTSAVQFVAPGSNGNLLTSNGTTWTSAAAPSSTPTTAQVLSATAGASLGAVGTYAAMRNDFNSRDPGQTVAGTWIRYTATNSDTTFFGTTPSGTWMAMGYSVNNGGQRATLYLRIS